MFRGGIVQMQHSHLRIAAARLELSDVASFAASAYLTRYATSPPPPMPAAATAGSRDGGAEAAAGADAEEEAAARVGACLFAACKACEQPRRARDVVNAVHLAARGEVLRDSRTYWRRKDALLQHEQSLLRALGFEPAVHPPHRLLYNYLHALRAPPQLCTLAAAIANDAAASADCVRRRPSLIAAAAIALAAALLGPALPVVSCRGVGGRPEDMGGTETSSETASRRAACRPAGGSRWARRRRASTPRAPT